eukprot:7100169-Alexandrium_andersonii.AAC.1
MPTRRRLTEASRGNTQRPRSVVCEFGGDRMETSCGCTLPLPALLSPRCGCKACSKASAALRG